MEWAELVPLQFSRVRNLCHNFNLKLKYDVRCGEAEGERTNEVATCRQDTWASPSCARVAHESHAEVVVGSWSLQDGSATECGGHGSRPVRLRVQLSVGREGAARDRHRKLQDERKEYLICILCRHVTCRCSSISR